MDANQVNEVVNNVAMKLDPLGQKIELLAATTVNQYQTRCIISTVVYLGLCLLCAVIATVLIQQARRECKRYSLDGKRSWFEDHEVRIVTNGIVPAVLLIFALIMFLVGVSYLFDATSPVYSLLKQMK